MMGMTIVTRVAMMLLLIMHEAVGYWDGACSISFSSLIMAMVLRVMMMAL